MTIDEITRAQPLDKAPISAAVGMAELAIPRLTSTGANCANERVRELSVLPGASNPVRGRDCRSARVFLGAALVVAAFVFAFTLGVGNSAAAKQAVSALQLNGTFTYPTSERNSVPCPTGTDTADQCFQFSGHAAIPGLGQVTDSFVLITGDDSLSCVPLSFTTDVITVGSKGAIDATVGTSGPCNAIPTTFKITGGTGMFAGASGSGTFTAKVGDGDDSEIDADDPGDWVNNVLTGTLTVPGATFDITAPTISAHPKTVTVPKKARFARVLYTVTAQDDTDATVQIVCKPPSGSRFKLGQTTVHCTATDSSANTATAKFVITVKHR
jgi:hypothetical protein